MKNFINRYTRLVKASIPSDVVSLLSQIHEYKGRQELFIQQSPENMDSLLEVAKIQSTVASNKIEGIYTSESRIKKLVAETTTPRNRDEQEISGYRDVLNTIHESYQYIHISKNIVLQLHRDLYKYNLGMKAGVWKQSDNVIEEVDTFGNTSVRFIPTSAVEVDEAIEQLCEAFNRVVSNSSNELMLSIVFILDFLCIHPFTDGNGRMSRLLNLLLLYKGGYIVGKYISLEHIIEKTKEHYYSSLKESSVDWLEDTSDIYPFVRYMLGVILVAYIDFEERVLVVKTSNMSKRDQIINVFSIKLSKITKSQIKELCPNVSEVLIEKTLKELLDSGTIYKVGAGKATGYIIK